ncbi:unnamed protein product, partial [Symbiodinium necroappetens]
MTDDTQVDQEADEPASPPNKKQRPDEVSATATRTNSELSLAAKSGSNLDFSALHQDLSPAGCSAKALAEGSELEPSSGPVVRQESVTFSADAVRRELGEQGTPVPSLVRKPAIMFEEMKKESRDDLPATLPAEAEALPQLPPEKMAKYDSWWKQWGRSASRDSDVSSAAESSEGSVDVLQTVTQMPEGPLKSALLEVLMQKEPAQVQSPAQAPPSVPQQPVQAPPSVPLQPVQAPASVPPQPVQAPPSVSGGDDRLQAFAKWMYSGGNGRAHADSGNYKSWAKVLEHFRNDTSEALLFAAKRRQQDRGTSVCRNTGEETFLLFAEESITWTTKKLDQITVEVGADLEVATRLAQMIEQHPHLFKKQPAADVGKPHDAVEPTPNDGTDAAADGSGKKPKGKAKAKAKAKSKADKQIHTELPIMDLPGLAAFKETWTKAVSDAQGHATTMVCELESFESQEKLCELINQAKEGLSKARKDMMAVDVSTESCRTTMDHILMAAKPYVQAYLKHTRIGAAKRENEKKKKVEKEAAPADKVPLQCKISYVVIPIVEIQQVKRLAGAAAARAAGPPKGRGKGRARGRGRSGYMNLLKKKGLAEKVIVYKKWPIFLPSNFAKGLAAAGADAWMQHPANTTFNASARKSAIPILIHGDEGQGKKDRNVLILNWHVLGVQTSSVLFRKFPIVIRGSNLAFSSSGKCLTMEALQAAVVESLSIAANPATAGIRGDATLQYCAGKGDWKYKKDWLCEKKDYSHSQFCRRCNCGQTPAGEHWLDFLHLSFNKPEMVHDNLHANVPETLPLRSLDAWSMDMEAADLLHVLWLGAARDSIGSVIMEIVTFDPRFQQSETFDGALAQVLTMVHDFCEAHGIDKSTIDELSLTKLHVDSVQYDYPLGLSKAFANKVLCSWVAHFLADTTVPQLQRPAVMMWALMQFNWLLEQSGLFFDDATAMRAYHHGILYCQLHVLAALDALQECRPRWK